MNATVLTVTCEIDPCRFDERWLGVAICTASGQEVRQLLCRTHGAMFRAGQIPCPDCSGPLEFVEFISFPDPE